MNPYKISIYYVVRNSVSKTPIDFLVSLPFVSMEAYGAGLIM